MSFDTLGRLGTHLTVLGRTAGETAARAVDLSRDAALTASSILSPVTAAHALSTLTAAAHQLSSISTTTAALGRGMAAAEGAYRAVENALANEADALFSRGLHQVERAASPVLQSWDTVVNAVQNAARLLVDTSLAEVTAHSVLNTLAPYVAAGAVSTYVQHVATSYRTILSDPFDPRTYPRMLQTWQSAGSDLMNTSVRTTQFMPDAQYAFTLQELPFLMNRLGFHDRAKLSTTSVVPAEEVTRRRERYTDLLPQKRLTACTSPRTTSELAYTMGMIDALGQQDESVIRVLHKKGSPPRFTVVIPSTKDWSPTADVPNDVTGNLNIMSGDSALLRASQQALDRAVADAGIGDTTHVKVMVAGFSQGGITAAAFAQHHDARYDVEQVVTLGAPIGRMAKIPARTAVLSYEFDDDVVPLLDHRGNPDRPGWETVHVPGGSHNAILYGEAAHQHPPLQPNRLNDFLSDGDRLTVTDYYARRDRG